MAQTNRQQSSQEHNVRDRSGGGDVMGRGGWGWVVPEHTHQRDEKHATQTASAQSTDDEAYETSCK
jgi:hypothetical protein